MTNDPSSHRDSTLEDTMGATDAYGFDFRNERRTDPPFDRPSDTAGAVDESGFEALPRPGDSVFKKIVGALGRGAHRGVVTLGPKKSK